MHLAVFFYQFTTYQLNGMNTGRLYRLARHSSLSTVRT